MAHDVAPKRDIWGSSKMSMFYDVAHVYRRCGVRHASSMRDTCGMRMPAMIEERDVVLFGARRAPLTAY